VGEPPFERLDACRILVRAPNWAGDVVMATPGFRALRAGLPRARIEVLVRPGLEPLLAGAPWFDAVRTQRSYHRGAAAFLREAHGLRAERYDVGLCLPDSRSSALFLRLAGVRRVVGYRCGGRGPLLHQAVEPPRENGARAVVARERHVLGLVEALGCAPRGTQLELFTTPEEEAAAERLLEAAGVAPGASLVALAPGASYGPSKLWPTESFARVGDALAGTGAAIVLVGAPSEAPLAARVRAAMRAPAADLTLGLDLGALKALLRRARLLVCNDAGARHVAVAFGVPAVVLMGPTSLAKTNMNLERVQVLAADVGCRPCYHRVCPIDHRCMTRLDPERVVAAARRALEAGAGAAAGLGRLPRTAEVAT
jgi:heptosyltransferase-2